MKNSDFNFYPHDFTKSLYFIGVLLVSINANAQTFYVATYGNDMNDGIQGTSIEKPWKTLSFAVRNTVAGDTIEMRGGEYRDSVFIPADKGGDALSYKTIQPYQSEEVFIKGSVVVQGWQQYGNDIYKVDNWNTNSQQVFVDGQPLQQIGWPDESFKDQAHGATSGPMNKYWEVGSGIGDLKNNNYETGTFYYDAPNKQLFVWLKGAQDPNTKKVEVSVGVRPMMSEAPYMFFKGLKFMHSNTLDTSEFLAGVEIKGSNTVLENVVISNMDFGGLKIIPTAKSVTVRNSYIGFNGNNGISCNEAQDFLIVANIISSNNTRNFNASWHAGGIKSTGIAKGAISHNEIEYNRGNGVWWDVGDGNWGSNTVEISGNYFRSNNVGNNPNGEPNGNASIHYEISKNGRIFNNVIEGGRRGVYLSASSDTVVAHNTIINVNEVGGIAGIEVAGVPRTGYRADGNSVLNNIVLNTSGSWDPGYRELKVAYRSDALNNVVDNNLYYRLGLYPRFTLIGEGTEQYPHLNVVGLDNWKTQNPAGFDLASIEASAAQPVVVGSGDFHLPPGSEAIDIGRQIDWIVVDKDNNPRAVNNPDAGAYEFQSADLAVTMTDTPDPAVAGDTVAYTLTVTNHGPSPTSGVTVTGTLPTCDLGTLASGASATCTRTVTANSLGTLTHSMTVSAREYDPVTANNTATATVTVTVPPYPAIDGFWKDPNSPKVYLFGKNFLINGVKPIVKFNEGTLLANVRQVSATQVIVLEPLYTKVGRITLQTPIALTISPTAYKAIQSGLTINGFSPTEAKVGTMGYIFGSGFSTTQANQVSINGVPAAFAQAADSTLLFYMVPAGASTGLVKVTTGGVTASSANKLVIVP